MIPIGAALDFMRGRWWLLGVVAAMAFALFQWGNARHWEKRYLQQVAIMEAAKRASADQLAANEHRLAEATTSFAAQAAQREPIIIHSRDTVREYAQTEAGAAQCLDAGRVDGVRASRDALFARDDPRGPGSGDGAVPPLPAP